VSKPDDVTVGSSFVETRLPVTPRTPGRSASSSLAPGSIIAGRYRLVALLGKGGMGEVYRGEDLTLDHPVALKFLPAGTAVGESQLAQFHNELRTARQVSHKNVCRLYDLGEADGRRFLTMEYVDGEDLASLLRRIGRLPADKAIEIARQLCAGLAAAHERGVVHRDLKPANVMIDGDGNVRITDFGLAVAAGAADAERAGTPQYMAPEQLAGKPATMQSDIYALGLILFEVFTGRRAFDAKTIADLIRQHESGQVTTPSSVVRDLDPAVERIILRCLEKDPAKRPPSALAVAAALPGANPLADALAAGETPSPELLAAAGEREALGVGRGLAALAVVVALLVINIAVEPGTSLTGLVPFDKPPAVLADRAQQILGSLGYTGSTADQASGFAITDEYLRHVAVNDRTPARWNVLRIGSPPVVRFWYRSSPRTMTPQQPQRNPSTSDPPMNVPGMTLVILDTRGRLNELHVVPPRFDPNPPADAAAAPSGVHDAPPNWAALFDAAGLRLDAFASAAPEWTPRDFADTRAAWTGPPPDRSDLSVRIEAAAYRGRPVSFVVVGPWTPRPGTQTASAAATSETILNTLVEMMTIAFSLAAMLLARHNVGAKRADTRGAARLAMAVIVGYFAAWIIAAHHVADVSAELTAFSKQFSMFLFEAALLWVFYLALEPYVRRFSPDAMLGWTRLLAGYVRDPRVGRDILTGCVCAFVVGFGPLLYIALPGRFGLPPPFPFIGTDVAALDGFGGFVGRLCDDASNALFVSLLAVLGFVLLRLIFRRTWIATAAAFLLLAMVQASQVLSAETSWWIAALVQLWIISAVLFIVVRYGLLVTAITLGLGNVGGGMPLTPHFSHWTATTSNLAIAVIVGLAAFGYYAARAGAPLFGKMEA